MASTVGMNLLAVPTWMVAGARTKASLRLMETVGMPVLGELEGRLPMVLRHMVQAVRMAGLKSSLLQL